MPKAKFKRHGPWMTKFMIDREFYGSYWGAMKDERIVGQFRRASPDARQVWELGIAAHDLAADLRHAYREGRLDRRMRVYLAPKLLLIDEVGYRPLDDLGATIFLQLVSARYERGGIILTSNKNYGEWGSIFGDSIIVTAVLDRLLHHSTTINIRGESYRLKDRRKAGLGPPRGQDGAEGAAPFLGLRPAQ